MPVTKVPVVHKFGIISSSQRLQLQERLHRQAYVTASDKRNQSFSSQRDPLEVTEEFIQIFNSADNFEDKDKCEEKARKLLERAKRRSGVKNCGLGSHVNLPLAWTELVQLAQCKGRIQEECLDILVTSLDVSPLERYHIPALFFLAETMLYWLRTEEVLYPFLRTGEMKLLKMGQLVFERLFYHHMTGQLQEHGDCKRRLRTYIDGLEELDEVYDLYTNALLYLRFISEVGKIILTDCQGDQGEINSARITDAPEQSARELNSDTRDVYEYYSHDEIRSNHSRAISSSVHDLSPTLWHALDVFRCTNSLSGGLGDAVKGLQHCGLGLASETWIDGMVAIQILGESAKTNMAAMKVLHSLALGDTTSKELMPSLPSSSRSVSSAVVTTSGVGGRQDKTEITSESVSISPGILKNSKVSLSDSFGDERKDEDNKRATTDTTRATTDNSSHDDRRQEVNTADIVHAPGIVGWHWEVSLTYVEVLEHIVLYGSTATIQKHALVGCNSENLHHHEVNSLGSAGLVNLVDFQPRNETTFGDWAWRIRYGALQSLVKISRSLKGDSICEGLRTTAWNALLRATAKEKDWRVLEALKVAQLHIDSNSLLDLSMQEFPVSLGKRMATGLSAVYLPPIPPPVAASPRVKHIPRSHPAAVHTPVRPLETKHLRTSLKQELQLASGLYTKAHDYNTRKSFDLRRIVEDQWRKELQAKLDEDEKEEMKSMKEMQQNEEERQRQIAASKQKKFQKKTPA